MNALQKLLHWCWAESSGVWHDAEAYVAAARTHWDASILFELDAYRLAAIQRALVAIKVGRQAGIDFGGRRLAPLLDDPLAMPLPARLSKSRRAASKQRPGLVILAQERQRQSRDPYLAALALDHLLGRSRPGKRWVELWPAIQADRELASQVASMLEVISDGVHAPPTSLTEVQSEEHDAPVDPKYPTTEPPTRERVNWKSMNEEQRNRMKANLATSIDDNPHITNRELASAWNLSPSFLSRGEGRELIQKIRQWKGIEVRPRSRPRPLHEGMADSRQTGPQDQAMENEKRG